MDQAALKQALQDTEIKSLEADDDWDRAVWLMKNTAKNSDLDECEYLGQCAAAYRILSRCFSRMTEARCSYNNMRMVAKGAGRDPDLLKKTEKPDFKQAQSLAHSKVATAIQSGDLVRPNLCSECKTECEPVAHHDSYDRPLDVRWLCRSCHGKHHAEHGRAECNGSAS
jgi:hypothetical protein